MNINESNFSLQICQGAFYRKCHICGNPSFSIPLQIVHMDGSTLCSTHSEEYLHGLHEALHLYLDKYRHNLRKIVTQKGAMYTLVIGFSNESMNTDDFLSEIGTILSMIADKYDLSSFYYFPQSDGKNIYSLKSKRGDIVKDETEYLMSEFGRNYGAEMINCLLLVDADILDFNEEWQLIGHQIL